ncbi:phosphatidate cytidylyltransferase [Evansella cellulosilytica]|uniref:Phosphatidate cytidylyltransferase n=1 Tax=Evansella cellulosilytica (strain ATCC 21833 / DSM 2522 / FERM P-1141 / JCM 9156 / N-4) TaxID=649639 RepID=E6TST0_EVAC2|nr:phosphatidate cytidylyltransferase [Evansella cellulosilytica]ADU30722.1 phosphatidate cytidylyltransferase [Evansella cellulosilytica DSM 2522]
MKQRIITAVIAGAGFLSLIIIGSWPFTLLMVALATIAMSELLKMKQINYFSPIGLLSFFLMWLLLVPEAIMSTDWLHINKFEMFLLLIILLLALTVITKNSFTFDEAGFVILSSVYIGFGFHFFIYTRFLDQGLELIFFILILVWATDSGAYFAGRSFGKHKLWPEISPKKTIEGAIGGIILAFTVGVIYTLFIPLFVSFVTTVIFIIVVSITGQLGDLVESALKRYYSVKDSGQVLPGHGGILDRFDSLIYVMPILYLLNLI